MGRFNFLTLIEQQQQQQRNKHIFNVIPQNVQRYTILTNQTLHRIPCLNVNVREKKHRQFHNKKNSHKKIAANLAQQHSMSAKFILTSYRYLLFCYRHRFVLLFRFFAINFV